MYIIQYIINWQQIPDDFIHDYAMRSIAERTLMAL